MNVRTMALVCGTVAVGFASAIVACSSSSSGGGSGNEDAGSSSSGSSSSGGSSSGSSSSGSSSSGSSSGSSSSGSSSGSTCKDPTVHAPSAGGTVFCGDGADGGDLYCSTGNLCCLGGETASSSGGFAADECNAIGTTCSNGTSPIPISCLQVADCTANGQFGAACCLQGGSNSGVPAAISGCDATDLKLSDGTAVVCESGSADAGAGDAAALPVPSCAAGETQICSSQADCPTGKTCTAMHWKTYEIGFCM